MKKLISSLLVGILTISLSFTSVSALSYDTTKIDNAYNKVRNYYESSKELNSCDEIIAVESLGLEAENGYQLPDDFGNIDVESASIGELTKTLISEVLLGKNPTNINGINLVEALENLFVDEEGETVIKNQGGYKITNSNELVYIVYALYVVDSNKLDDAVNLLINSANEDGSFGYGGSSTSLDITGWVLEALALTQKDITKTLEFLNGKLDDNDGAFSYLENWGEAGKNANTQSCILSGLFTNDKSQLINGYENSTIHPIDYLINLQKDDGSFYYRDGEDGWNPASTTWDAAKAIGTYKNGSVYQKAKNNFKKLMDNQNTLPNPDDNNDKQETASTTNQPIKSVQTGDQSQIEIFISLSFVSGALYLILRKEYERTHI